MSIQADYGRFNPAYIGVVILASTQQSLDWLDRSASITEVEVLALPPHEAFDAISMVTVFPHEVRHFHDFLLTPYSQRLWRLRNRTVVHGMQLYVALTKLQATRDFNCLPLPLNVWCKKGAAERRATVQHLDSQLPPPKGDGWRPCELPMLPPADDLLKAATDPKADPVVRLIAATTYYQEQISDLSLRPQSDHPPHIHPRDVFELSGLLCQLQAIWSDLGRDALVLFLDMMEKTSRAPYMVLFQGLQKIWEEHARPMDLRIASSLVLWSLLGCYEQDGRAACPTHRFSTVCLRLIREGPPSSPGSIMSLWDRWSDVTGLSRVKPALDRALRRTDEYATTKDHIFTGTDWTEVLQRPRFTAYVEAVCTAQSLTMRQLLKDPESYVFPDLYLERPNWVNPPVRCDVLRGGVAANKDFERRGHVVYRGYENSDGIVVAQSFYRPVTLSDIKILEPSLVHEMFIQAIMSDLLCRQDRRDDPDLRFAQRLVHRELRVLPFNVDI